MSLDLIQGPPMISIQIYNQRIERKIAWLRYCAKAFLDEDLAYEFSRQHPDVTASDFSWIWSEVRA